jgi:hypothetical protein
MYGELIAARIMSRVNHPGSIKSLCEIAFIVGI